MKLIEIYDMHSGGSQKLDYPIYYVRARDEDDGARIFEEITGRDPSNVTCRCCGDDYSVDEVSEEEYQKNKSKAKMLN